MARLPIALLALALTASPAVAAEVRSLPTQTHTLTTLATANGCTAGARTPRGAVDIRWRARTDASLLARSLGLRASGDWDLLLLDARGAKVSAARGSGSREAVQATVTAGTPVTVRACRQAGAAPRLRLRLEAIALTRAPRSAGQLSLVTVQTRSRADANRLAAAGFDLGEDGHGGDISVVVHSAREMDALRRTGLPLTVTVSDLAAHARRNHAADARPRMSTLPSGRTTYRNYEEIQAELKALAAKYPDIARPYALPLPSFQGREISGIEIGAPITSAARDGRPTFFVVGTHHAREWPTAEVAMEHVIDLLGNRDEPTTRSLLERAHIVVVPVQNPDGYTWSRAGLGDYDDAGAIVFGAGTDIQAYRRRTCSGALPPAAPCDLQLGTDSNRNYGPNWGANGASSMAFMQTYRGDSPWSEPETEGVHQALQQLNATLVISLHNVLGAVLRPPGLEADFPMPEDPQMAAIGERMAEVTGYLNTTFYEGLGYDGGGITEDWTYGSLGAYTFSFEIGGNDFHGPYETHVEKQWNGPDNAGGMRAALRIALDAALDEAHHSRLDIRTRPGATLRLAKEFTEQTAAPCTVAPGLVVQECVAPGTPIELPDKVAFEMTAPASGSAVWHVPPSTRPLEKRDGKTENYTLTCFEGTTALESKPVVIDRGARAALECAAPPKAAAKPKVKAKRCRKGYKRKKVRGKSRCVRKKSARRGRRR